MILIQKSLDIKVSEQINDNEGRFIILLCSINGVKFLIYNVYAPNNEADHERFMINLKESLNTIDTNNFEYIMGVGDWNFTEENIDRDGGNYTKWNKSINIMEELNGKYDAIDIWRVRNPEHSRYTWRQGRPIIQSRIDRMYISDTLQYNVSNTDIIPGINSDHSAVKIEFKSTTNKNQTGPSYWKFNANLLKNEEFTKGLTQHITTEIAKECEEIESAQVKWEYTKFKIKEWSIRKSKQIAKERRKHEKELENQLLILEGKLKINHNEEIYEELEECKSTLEGIHNKITESLIIQSRVQFYEEGEKKNSF